MKRKTLWALAGICLLLISSVVAIGQLTNAGVRSSEDFTFARKATQKNSADFLRRNEINAAVLRSFIKAFKNVTDEKWHESPDGFVAMFTLRDINYQVMYTKKGDWTGTIRSYRENDLSPDVRHLVKRTYYDYDINLVQEIDKPLNPATYIIQLIGKTEILKVGVCNDEMTVLQTFKKSE